MNELFCFPAISHKCSKIFIISDKVSENINHILKTAWVIKWANVTVLQKPGTTKLFISLSLRVCARVRARGAVRACLCLCVWQHQTERECVACLPVPVPPSNPRAADSRQFPESNNFTQLLEEEMNWAQSNNKIIQMLLQTRLLLSYFNSNLGTPGGAGGRDLPE